MQTFNYRGDDRFERGEFENGQIFIQLKATDTLETLADGHTIPFQIKRRHALLWEEEPMPVYLIVYSVADRECYWLHVQSYLKSEQFRWPPNKPEEMTVHLSKNAVVNAEVIEEFRREKQRVLTRIGEARLYG